MMMQKPRVEFVPIEYDIKTVPTPSDPTGGGQYCVGTQPKAAYCPDWVDDVDWG